MGKSDLIAAILEIDSCHEKSELKKMSLDELKKIYEDLTDESGMYPNGHDYDADDED